MGVLREVVEGAGAEQPVMLSAKAQRQIDAANLAVVPVEEITQSS